MFISLSTDDFELLVFKICASIKSSAALFINGLKRLLVVSSLISWPNCSMKLVFPRFVSHGDFMLSLTELGSGVVTEENVSVGRRQAEETFLLNELVVDVIEELEEVGAEVIDEDEEDE